MLFAYHLFGCFKSCNKYPMKFFISVTKYQIKFLIVLYKHFNNKQLGKLTPESWKYNGGKEKQMVQLYILFLHLTLVMSFNPVHFKK